ncbi:hypothetical protein C8F01DRAFT_1262486 [Mycena amicta]|nr:hypothetical protein C8F01DRAFT_1262486 [Mycena amicta]
MLVCSHVMPGNLVWLAMFTVEARLFANSLLASLNSRSVLRGMCQQSGLIGQLSLSIPATNNSSQTRGISVEMRKFTESGKDTEFE